MSVTFVIGRSGSGKTQRCFTRISEALRSEPLGPPIYWLLPRQATFEAERRLACGAGLPGFCRARIVSFATLGKEILGEAGGSEIPEVTAIGRQMILGHLLREHAANLVFFKSIERQAGLAAELDATFDELERAGKSADDLTALINELSQDRGPDVESQTLLAKLRDVRLLYGAYNDFLGADRLDPHRRLQQVVKAMKASTSLDGATVYVDGFFDITDHERQMLGAIAGAGATMEITLLMDPASPLLQNPHQNPHDMSLFHRTETTYRRLWVTFHEAGIAINEPVLLKENLRAGSPALKHLEREMFPAPGAKPASFADAQVPILRIEAPDRVAEVDAIARHIRERIKTGDRFRDIAVLMRGLNNHQALIAASFGEHQIPFFVDHRKPAAHHPLICFLRAALQAALFDWNHDAIIALTRTGLAGLQFDEADELENYVLSHRVRAGSWESAEPWAWRRDLLRPAGDENTDAAQDPAHIDELRRRVADGLSPLVHLLGNGKPLPVREVAAEIFQTIARFGVRETLSEWMKAAESRPGTAAQPTGRAIEERDGHLQVWSNLCGLFDEMVELLGDKSLTPTDFVDVVESGLDRFDLGITPPTVDQVLVGPADRTRCPPVKVVYVLGLSEGEFPVAPLETSVLSDRDRRKMMEKKLELDPDGKRLLLDERLLGYVTMTQASRQLVLCRPMGDGAGRAAAPSALWHRVGELFPGVETVTVQRESNSVVEQIATPRQFVTGLMRWAGKTSADKGGVISNQWFALYEWFASRGSAHPAINHLRENAWPALSYSNETGNVQKFSAMLFKPPLSLDARQLETMAECPFKHFVRYGLKLSSRQKSEVGGGDLGQVYHRLLDELLNKAIAAAAEGDLNSFAISRADIHAAAMQIAKALRGELMLSSARNRYLLYRIERTLVDAVATLQATMKHSRFRPAGAGISFGGEKGALPALTVRTPAGDEMALHGKIDRIDMLPGGSEAVVVDYRLGSNSLSLQHVFHGLSLQLLTTLLAMKGTGNDSAGRELAPMAAFYVGLLRPLEDVDHPDDAPDPLDEKFLLAKKPRGIFDHRVLADLDTGLQTGASMLVQVHLNKDGNVGHRATTDSAESDDFDAVLRLVMNRLEKLGDAIFSGRIAIAPYRLAKETPCPSCEYRGVCRFETPMNRYNHLAPLGREGVLDVLRQEAKDGK